MLKKDYVKAISVYDKKGTIVYSTAIDLEEVIAAFLPLDSANADKRHVWIIDKYINQAQSPKLRIAA